MPASPDDGARYAARAADLVADLELYLLQQLASHLRAGTDADWERSTLAGLQRWRAAAERGIRGAEARLLETITRVLLDARNDGTALALTDLETAAVTSGAVRPPRATLNRAGELAQQVMGTLLQAPTLLERVYRDAVAVGAAETTGGKVTRLQAAQHVLDRLGTQGVTGFRDKAGRNWSLTSYVEMAVRTEAGHQAVQGHVDTLAAAGLDLIVVSDSPRECPLCRPWEGKVLSLSGAVGALILPSATGGSGVRVTVAGSLDEARAAGLQHPNCRHTVSAFIPGATRLVPATAEPAGYDAVQRQRAMERKVREWKRREALALDPTAAAYARAKTRQWQAALREHVDANDLKRLTRREQINHAT